MRKDKRKTDRRMMGVLVAGMMMAMTTAGCQGAKTSEGMTETEGTTSEVITETEWTTPVVMTEKEWTIPVIELGETMDFSEDVKDYVELEQVTDENLSDEESLYDELTLESDVDLTAPGEYTIKVTGYGQEADFPVVVQDTTYPDVMVLDCIYLAKIGREPYTLDDFIYAYSDNDTVLYCGMYGFEKVGEIDGYDYGERYMSDVVYTETKWDPSLELMNEIVVPEEEGVYQATAVVVDRSGNAVTSDINFVVYGEDSIVAQDVDVDDYQAVCDFYESIPDTYEEMAALGEDWWDSLLPNQRFLAKIRWDNLVDLQKELEREE
jgi:hypothetical protein